MEYSGKILLVLSFILTLFVAITAIYGGWKRKEFFKKLTFLTFHAITLLNIAISALLLYGILTHDFSNVYITSYTDKNLPFLYLLTSFWAGEKGAILFWVLILSIIGSLVIYQHRNEDLRFISYTVSIIAFSIFFFEILLVFPSNPFETFPPERIPPDGNGLNPLLQNLLMAFHPPTQLGGFLGWTIPYAFAISSLLCGRRDNYWIKISRKWTILAWLLLTIGLVLGSLWAYVELGWGGFWGWDPVENAGFFPWLTATAFIHTAILEDRIKGLKRWNISLIIITFLLTIFATFLTRSQLISSLHAFSDSVLAPYFMYYMLIIVLFSYILLGFRWKVFTGVQKIRFSFSKETFIIIGNVLFLCATFIILWGTLLPKISESKSFQSIFNLNKPLNVGAQWFNKMISPVGILLLLTMLLGALTNWNHTRIHQFFKNSLPSFLITSFVLLTFIIIFYLQGKIVFEEVKIHHIYGVLTIFFSLMFIFYIITEILRDAHTRAKNKAENLLKNIIPLISKNKRHYVGNLTHLGVAFLFVGFSGGAFKKEVKDIVLNPGKGVLIDKYELIFLETEEKMNLDEGYASSVASILVHQKAGKKENDNYNIKKYLNEIGFKNYKFKNPSGSIFHELIFNDEIEFLRFAFSVFFKTTLIKSFEVVDFDDENWEIYFQPNNIDILMVIPWSFHKYVQKVKNFFSNLSEAIVFVNFSPGSPVFYFKFQNEQLYLESKNILMGEIPSPPVRFFALDKEKGTINIIPEGKQMILTPEVRFYLKHENPTTEVAIKTNIFEDFYVAVAPAKGNDEIMLTAMLNPFLMWLWIGSVIIFVCVFIFLIDRKKIYDG